MPALNLNPGIVYFLMMEDVGGARPLPFYKIGITDSSTSSRIKQLQTGNPYRIVERDSFDSEAAQLIELHMHKTRAENRIRLEWFQFTEEEIVETIEAAKIFNAQIQNMAADVREFDKQPSNGQKMAADEHALELHEQALELLHEETRLKIKRDRLKALLEALTVDSSGIEGITEVSVTKPPLSFKSPLFRDRYPELYEQYCTDSSLACGFSITGKPSTKNFPNEKKELDEAKEQVAEIGPGEVQETDIPRANQACDFHDQFLSTLAELNRIKGEFQVIELELRHNCGENEEIENVCKYKRSLNPKLDKDTLKKEHPVEYDACFEVGQPTRRFKVLESRDY